MASSLVDVPDGKGGLQPLTIITMKHTSDEEIVRNVTANMKRDVFRFMNLPLLRARNEPLAICGGGPSLNQYADKIKEFGQVMTCGSAHDHVVDLGITPTFALAVDAMEDAVNWFQKPQEKTSYLLASQCHPNMYDHLKDHKIAMWHFKGQADDESIFNGEPTINWGCMVGVLSVQTALYLGFQHLHFFGFDCCYLDERHHAYDIGEEWSKKVDERKDVFSVNGKTFASTTALVSQMEHLFDVFSSPDGAFLKGTIYGDGLWANTIAGSDPRMQEWLEAPDVSKAA